MPNTFVDGRTFQKILAAEIRQDMGAEALSVGKEFIESGTVNSAIQYLGYVGTNSLNNAVTPSILLPIVDNGIKAFSQSMEAVTTGGGAAIVCTDSILKNYIRYQMVINQLSLAHQRIINIALLGLSLILIIIFVKTTKRRLRYWRELSKNLVKHIKTKVNQIKTNRKEIKNYKQKIKKYRRQEKLLMLEKCYTWR